VIREKAHHTRGLGRGNSVLHFVEVQYFHGTPYIIRCSPLPDVSFQAHDLVLGRSIQWLENFDGLGQLVAGKIQDRMEAEVSARPGLPANISAKLAWVQACMSAIDLRGVLMGSTSRPVFLRMYSRSALAKLCVCKSAFGHALTACKSPLERAAQKSPVEVEFMEMRSSTVTQVYQRIRTPLAVKRRVSGTLEAKVLLKSDRLRILFVNVRGEAREPLKCLIY
jgi:hypothetical protein